MGSEKVYCKYCFNARIFEENTEEEYWLNPITEENDFGACTIDNLREQGKRIMMAHGYREAPRILAEEWSERRSEWVTTAIYYPKFCPECGRKIDEYDKETHR